MSDNNKIFNFINDADPEVDYTGASAQKYIDSYTNRPEDRITKEGVQNTLATLGIGFDPFDWLNAAIYWHAGDKLNAALYGSGIGILGVGAIASKGSKVFSGKQIMKATKDLDTDMKYVKGSYGKDRIKQMAQDIKDRFAKKQRYINTRHEAILKEFDLTSFRQTVKKYKDHDHHFLMTQGSPIWEQAKKVLKKELMSDESYKKWRTLMEKSDELAGFSNPSSDVVQFMKSRTGKLHNINPERYKMGNYSKEWYAHYVESTINKTHVVPVGRGKINLVRKRLSGWEGDDVAGFFSHVPWNPQISSRGVVYIDEEALFSNIGPAVLVHELKHAVQLPFMPAMKKVYGDVIETLNTQWKKDRFNPRLGHSQQTLLGRLEQDKYIMKPQEVSARLSEMRSDLPTNAYMEMFGTNRASIDNVYTHWLKGVFENTSISGTAPWGLKITPGMRGIYNQPFNPRDLSRLDKTIWGAPGAGLTLDKYNKIFDED